MAKATKAQQQQKQRDQRMLDIYDLKLQTRLLRLALESGKCAGLCKNSAAAAAVAAYRLEIKLHELLPAEA